MTKYHEVDLEGTTYYTEGAKLDYSINRDGELEDAVLAERGSWFFNDGSNDAEVKDAAVIAELDMRLLGVLERDLLQNMPEPCYKEDEADYYNDLKKDGGL